MKRTLILAVLLMFFGLVQAQRMYDGSGRQIGKIDGDRLYDGSGRQIGKADGLKKIQAIIFFYFYM